MEQELLISPDAGCAGLSFPDVPVPGCLDRFLETAMLLLISSMKEFFFALHSCL